jgi:hypothetical protein
MPEKKTHRIDRPSIKEWLAKFLFAASRKNNPTDEAAPPLEDNQVVQRLVGDKAKPFVEVKPFIPRPKKARLSDQKNQNPGSQSDSGPTVPQPEIPFTAPNYRISKVEKDDLFIEEWLAGTGANPLNEEEPENPLAEIEKHSKQEKNEAQAENKTESASNPAESHLLPAETASEEDTKENLEELRSEAISGYEVEPGVIFEEPKKPLFARLRRWFDQQTNFSKTAIGIILFLFVGGVTAFTIYTIVKNKASTTANTPPIVIDSSVPIPTNVTFPDGESFDLVIGYPEDSQILPKNPEWLAGTEVPRWLVIPLGKNLQKAILSFKTGDQIILKMNNGEIIDYAFQSTQKVAVEDLSNFHSRTADLLIILGQTRGSSRTVIIASP